MASLVRPTVVRYTLAGRRVPKGTPGAVKVRERAKKWYGQGIPGVRGRVPLATDRRTAERMLAELVVRGERGRAGLPEDLPLGPLLAEWAGTIDGEATHVREVTNHARLVLDGCGIRTLAELRARGVAARVERLVQSLQGDGGGLSGRTAAAYGSHTRQFTRWLWRKRELLDADPLAGLDLPSQRPETPRRDLTPDELRALLDVARRSPRAIKRLTGPARACLYLTAACTGYRAGELAALTPAHFRLDDDPPTVCLSGEETKDDRYARQILPAQVAGVLKAHTAGISRHARVWPGNWFKKAPALLRADLAAAGLQARTERGDAVFHSLRHSLSSMLAGVASVKVHQEIMRHKDSKTSIDIYTHAGDGEKAAAMAALPLFAGGPRSPFEGLTRAELEDLAGGLWAALAVILNPTR